MHIGYAFIVCVSHNDTFCRTNSGTKSTVHALGHVNSEQGSVQPFTGTVRLNPHIFHRLDSLNINAIHRANLCAKIANDTIVDLHMKLVTSRFRNRYLFAGILNGYKPLLLFEIVILCYSLWLPLLSGMKNMIQGHLQSFPGVKIGREHV